MAELLYRFSYGTKVGMKPLENESLVNDISLLHPGLLVTECVYNPIGA